MVSAVICYDNRSTFLKREKIDITSIYTKYIFKLAICIVVFGFGYGFYKYGNIFGGSFKIIVGNILSGNAYYHMWYLYMLIGLYIITPFIHSYVKNAKKDNIQYFLLIGFIFTSIIPFLNNFTFLEIFTNGIAKLDILLFNGFIFFYVLGYYLSTYEISKKIKKVIYYLGPITLITSAFINNYFSYIKQEPVSFFGSLSSPSSVLFVMAIFIFLKDYAPKIKAEKIIVFVSNLTFGVYLVHPLILELMQNRNIHANMINPILGVPLIIVITFIMSLLLSWILSKIPFIKKLL